MKKIRKSHIISALLIFILVSSIAINPTKQDYLEFSEDHHVSTPSSIEIERMNFYLFSTYTPVMPMDHYGIVYIGFMGNFFQVSDGQYDYPWWLEFFN